MAEGARSTNLNVEAMNANDVGHIQEESDGEVAVTLFDVQVLMALIAVAVVLFVLCIALLVFLMCQRSDSLRGRRHWSTSVAQDWHDRHDALEKFNN